MSNPLEAATRAFRTRGKYAQLMEVIRRELPEGSHVLLIVAVPDDQGNYVSSCGYTNLETMACLADQWLTMKEPELDANARAAEARR